MNDTANNTDQLDKYELELWQIVRFHNNHIKVSIDFTPHHGDIFYCLSVIYNGGCIHFSQGRNLWKRYREALETLKTFFGDKAHTYEL